MLAFADYFRYSGFPGRIERRLHRGAARRATHGAADMQEAEYVLPRGVKGRERLRVLAGVMRDGTTSVLDKAGIHSGLSCLDVACGGGDVAMLLAARVGAAGRVLGIDHDPEVIRIAAEEAAAQPLPRLSYRVGDVFDLSSDERFDVVYCRFLLTHLPERARALDCMLGALEPGGLMIVEDIDFAGHLCLPEHPAMDDYLRLYVEIARRNGGDPFIGPKLPMMLKAAGLADIEVDISQPLGLSGDAKVVNALTMEGIGPRVVAAGLATDAEVGRIVDDLYAVAEDPTVLASIVRVIQTWGRKAA
jgi:2-polyprenyl-3-methyl-5-hydroxy-6-metoxy-1,4-benzoquinol methylase